jgi:hypothetical protein
MTFPFTAMGMPQKEVFENRILAMKEGNGASYSCYGGVANLIHFREGRVNVVRYWSSMQPSESLRE